TRRVLLAEDNAVNQKVASRILEKLGCQVEIAANGADAVRMCSSRAFHLVLMDCQMPEMDGYAAAAEIRRLENGSRRTPIVALTAHALPNDRQECLDAGMDDYLAKPFDADALRSVIDRWAR
ncbi:MAG: response regulator, partial [Bryobacteraceae bacterium]